MFDNYMEGQSIIKHKGFFNILITAEFIENENNMIQYTLSLNVTTKCICIYTVFEYFIHRSKGFRQVGSWFYLCYCCCFSKQRAPQSVVQTSLKKQRGPIASQGRSIPIFLRKRVATCDFPGGPELLSPL